MDAEAIVKAMREAGITGNHHVLSDGKTGIYAYGYNDQWSRFRGVSLDEVEKALQEQLWLQTLLDESERSFILRNTMKALRQQIEGGGGDG